MSCNAALPTVLVLASGRGARYTASGGATQKLQADLCGKSVLQHTLDAVRASGLPWHLEDRGYPGMGDSIAAGVRATRAAAGWLILPADLPLISPHTLLFLASAATDADVLVPVYQGQRGHPVRFARRCGNALSALHGEAGAAAVANAFHKAMLPVDDVGCITDIDTLADLERAVALYAVRNSALP